MTEGAAWDRALTLLTQAQPARLANGSGLEVHRTPQGSTGAPPAGPARVGAR